MDMARYQKMKKQVEQLRSEAERAAGREEQLMKQLKDQFGCTTIEEAQDKLKQLQTEAEKAKKVFDRKFDLFEAEWGEKLKEVEG